MVRIFNGINYCVWRQLPGSGGADERVKVRKLKPLREVTLRGAAAVHCLEQMTASANPESVLPQYDAQMAPVS